METIRLILFFQYLRHNFLLVFKTKHPIIDLRQWIFFKFYFWVLKHLTFTLPKGSPKSTFRIDNCFHWDFWIASLLLKKWVKSVHFFIKTPIQNVARIQVFLTLYPLISQTSFKFFRFQPLYKKLLIQFDIMSHVHT